MFDRGIHESVVLGSRDRIIRKGLRATTSRRPLPELTKDTATQRSTWVTLVLATVLFQSANAATH